MGGATDALPTANRGALRFALVGLLLLLSVSFNYTFYLSGNMAICSSLAVVQRFGHLNSSGLISSSKTHPADQAAASGSSIKLFLGVLSAPGNVEARATVRQTWGSVKTLSRLMFFVLRPRNDTTFMQLRSEAVTHGDVVITSEVYEGYYNITYAVLDIFKTAAVMGDAFTHVAKTDDDCYVRLNLLLPALEAMPHQWLYAGAPMTHGSVIRSTGWHHVPYSNWASDQPVRYGFGMGYILTMDLAKEIAAGAPHMIMAPDNLLIIEDVAVAYWVAYVGKEKNITINYEAAIKHSESCTPGDMFLHVKSKPQWKVIQCMYDRGGACC
jgi:hypothetical protein